MDGKVRVFRNQPEVDLENDPDWTRDPLESKTWRLYYHGLTWLLAPAWGAIHGFRRRPVRQLIHNVVDSYLTANVFRNPADSMAWDDHATADRLATICWLIDRIPSLERAVGRDRTEMAISTHIDKLIEFCESAKWIQSNHGLFHALALLDVPLVFPEHPHSQRATNIGRQYLARVISNLVDPDEGISTEQSLHYHQFAIRVFRSIRPFLSFHYTDLQPLVERALDGMVEFNWCIAGWDDSMPAIGDTRTFDRIPSDALQIVEEAPAAPPVVRTHDGEEAGRDLPDLVVYPNSGYAVFRHRDRSDPRVSRAIMVAHPSRVSHGHFDALSVTLQLEGKEVLIDSGGPYAYGDFLRFGYFVASRAHNVVLIDDANHEAPGEITSHGSHDGCHWVTALHRGYEDRTVIRTAVWFPGHTFVVFDRVTDGKQVTFDCLWHLPPGTNLSNIIDGELLRTRIDLAQRTFYSGAIATTALEPRVVEGVLDPQPQGWITTKLQEKEPAPVLAISAVASELCLVTYFSTHDRTAVSRQGNKVRATLDGIGVEVDQGGIPHFSTKL